ncbi:MAG: polysaccharide biosynthesis/export family protein [Saprospiraceae bacterium]
MKQIILKLIIFLVIAFSMTSCVQYEELLYFRKDVEVDRPQFPDETIQNLAALRIQKNDVLSITVHAFDPIQSAPFNLMQPGVGGGGNGSASPFTSYIVDEDGEIDFPVLGKILLKDLTATEAKNKLVELLKVYLKDPVVNIRFVNFRISVLGEVSNPGTFVINNDRITVLEALGMAGDLTPYSNRTNILVVREQNGIRQFGELNIQSPEIFRSEYYYLKQGDIVYIEPTQDIEASIRDQFSEYLPWVTSSLSAITTIIAILNIGQ